MPLSSKTPLKSARRRRTNAELEELDRRLVAIVAENKPVTVRGAFYQAEVAGLVPKDENGYDLVQRRLVRLRQRGLIPYGSITDGTRIVRRESRWNGLDDFATHAAQFYRRDYWAKADVRVEIWIEKDALSGVIYPTVVSQWGLDLFVARGFSSITYLQNAAENIRADGRKTFVYVLGDFDPSGLCAAQKVASELPERARGVDVEVTHLAVTREQIEDWNLPTREVKRSDSRAPKFISQHGEISVELDAIPPKELRSMVSRAISRHADHHEIAMLKQIEDEERSHLIRWSRGAAGSSEG
jgi:hypothetical protein